MQVLIPAKLSLKSRLSKTWNICNRTKGWVCVLPTGYQNSAGAEMTLSWLGEGGGHFLGVTNIWRSTNRVQSPCWENAWALSLSHCVTPTRSTSPRGASGCARMCCCRCARAYTRTHGRIIPELNLNSCTCKTTAVLNFAKLQLDGMRAKWRILGLRPAWCDTCTCW